MNMFVTIILVSGSLVWFQLLMWFNGEYVGKAYEERRQELLQRLASRDSMINNPWKRLDYWPRFVCWSFYIWPFRVIVINLIVIMLCIVLNHYALNTR